MNRRSRLLALLVVPGLLLGGAGCVGTPSGEPSAQPPRNGDPPWVQYTRRYALDVARPGQTVGRRMRVFRSGRVSLHRLVRTDTAGRLRVDERGHGRLTSGEKSRLEALLDGLNPSERPERLPSGNPALRGCRTPASSVTLTVNRPGRAVASSVRVQMGCDAEHYPAGFLEGVRGLSKLMDDLFRRLDVSPAGSMVREAAG